MKKPELNPPPVCTFSPLVYSHSDLKKNLNQLSTQLEAGEIVGTAQPVVEDNADLTQTSNHVW